MDSHGDKWHHADPLSGTLGAGQAYQEGFGIDGFGGGVIGNTEVWGLLNVLWNNTPDGTDASYNNVAGATGGITGYFYGNASGSGQFVTQSYLGATSYTAGETYSYSGYVSSFDFNSAASNIGNGFLGGLQNTWEGITSQLTWKGYLSGMANTFTFGLYGNVELVHGAVSAGKNLSNYTAADYQYGAGFVTEKIAEFLLLKRLGGAGEGATLYRNFGWNELGSIKSSGGKFSIHPNQFQGKQFWVGESGMEMWNSSSFAKPFTAKITVPKSFVTPGSKNYMFMETDMMIDGFPGGTVLPGNLSKFNSAMKIDWIRY